MIIFKNFFADETQTLLGSVFFFADLL